MAQSILLSSSPRQSCYNYMYLRLHEIVLTILARGFIFAHEIIYWKHTMVSWHLITPISINIQVFKHLSCMYCRLQIENVCIVGALCNSFPNIGRLRVLRAIFTCYAHLLPLARKHAHNTYMYAISPYIAYTTHVVQTIRDMLILYMTRVAIDVRKPTTRILLHEHNHI